MKRELRLPSKGYDLLRRQVQARRGSATNRDPEETAEPAVAPLEATDANPPETAGEQFAGEPSAADGEAAEDFAPADRQAPPEAAREAQGPAATMARDGKADRRSSKSRKTPSLPAASPASPERITLKVNVRAPEPSLFPFYDRVIETMPPRRALPLLLAKAFEDLEAEVADGATLELKDYAFPDGAERISTSRTMDLALFQKMRAQIDPYELMRKTSIGTAIATSALCLYLTKRS
jgi:hypothetical protein